MSAKKVIVSLMGASLCCFAFLSFLSQANQAQKDLRWAEAKEADARHELRLTKQENERLRSERVKLQSEYNTLLDKKNVAETLASRVRLIESEAQSCKADKEQLANAKNALSDELEKKKIQLDEERAVSKKYAAALDNLWVEHNRTKKQLRSAEDDLPRYGACKDSLTDVTVQLRRTEADLAKARKELSSEAERVKECEDNEATWENNLNKCKREKRRLEERLEEREAAFHELLNPTRGGAKKEPARDLVAATWNVAAVNNNPFEYWITGTDEYNKLMEDVAGFINTPGDRDIAVGEVLTNDMWEDLRSTMSDLGWPGVDKVAALWEGDFKKRKIISGFIKDKLIGKKRLASMPDRYTNTISTVSGSVMRPTVINCYTGDLGTMEKWWKAWKAFMFQQEVEVVSKKGTKKKMIFEMLKKIKRSKYPAVTEEEEKISVALQTLAGAIFDGVLVHMMNQLAPGTWERLRTEMCDKLNRGKSQRTVEILETEYAKSDVVFLQEVASEMVQLGKTGALSKIFDIVVPEKFDSDRNQNSVMLLKKGEWSEISEVTAKVMLNLNETDGKVPVTDGDLLALTAVRSDGEKYLLASFHGDTNGLATIPIVTAVAQYVKARPELRMVFGMDANTYETPSKDQQGITPFAEFYVSKGLTSCYGDNPNPKNYTTFHARTYLQPQLNKAVSYKERDEKGDKNPKDHILFDKKEFVVLQTQKDNTGEGRYEEGMVFPTLRFPSDHGVTRAILRHASLMTPPPKAEVDEWTKHDEGRDRKVDTDTSKGDAKKTPEAPPTVKEAKSEDVSEAPKELQLLTWNVAAVNNNPFEYWITGTDEYNKLMEDVAGFITDPGEKDVTVKEVFTPAMWEELKAQFAKLEWDGDKVAEYWEKYKERKVVTEFLKDKSIGKKRLASMPDRVTNTIVTTTGTVMRPTVINCYAGDLGTTEKWWTAWKDFMFQQEVEVVSKKGTKKRKVFEMLKKIKRSKYPAVTEEEESLSLPLQTLAGAIFDGVLVHMMNQLAPGTWERLRTEMCDKLNRGKSQRIQQILEEKYSSTTDVVFLQEVAQDLVDSVRSGALGGRFTVHVPAKFDSDRNQNSIILLKKGSWDNIAEVTDDVLASIDKSSVPIVDGDLFAITASADGEKYLLASFHGDTNGLATIPIVTAVAQYVKARPELRMVFGMDANTYETPSKDQQGITPFAEFYVSKGLTSCYGDNPNPKNYTTFHARTYLQPQLNKAVSYKERDEKGDKNPKDHILFDKKEFVVLQTQKDNTGEGRYEEGMVFPTLRFPSDHGITRAVLLRTAGTPSSQGTKVVSWSMGESAYPLDSALLDKAAKASGTVGEVVPSAKWEELKALMEGAGWKGVDAAEEAYTKEAKRTIADLITDSQTRDIVTAAHNITARIATSSGVVVRPSPLACHKGSGDLWEAWKTFIFTTPLPSDTTVKSLLSDEYRGTAPLPVATLYLALFDLAVGHSLGGAALTPESCPSGVLPPALADADVILLHAAPSAQYLNTIAETYHTTGHAGAAVLLRKERWEEVADVTADVAKGDEALQRDLHAVTAKRSDGKTFLFASYNTASGPSLSRYLAALPPSTTAVVSGATLPVEGVSLCGMVPDVRGRGAVHPIAASAGTGCVMRALQQQEPHQAIVVTIDP